MGLPLWKGEVEDSGRSSRVSSIRIRRSPRISNIRSTSNPRHPIPLPHPTTNRRDIEDAAFDQRYFYYYDTHGVRSRIERSSDDASTSSRIQSRMMERSIEPILSTAQRRRWILFENSLRRLRSPESNSDGDDGDEDFYRTQYFRYVDRILTYAQDGLGDRDLDRVEDVMSDGQNHDEEEGERDQMMQWEEHEMIRELARNDEDNTFSAPTACRAASPQHQQVWETASGQIGVWQYKKNL